jgi:RNA polymerase sigma-70 factor (TIGR02960 family)
MGFLNHDGRAVAADLITRARAGDGEAFRELTEPHRRELQVHCYRMLGSFQDAEDVVQDTLLAAWRALADFEERASLRTWLYRIATNRCLNAIRSTARRPAQAWNIPGAVPPDPSCLNEAPWLEPFPDALLDPAARFGEKESISLAFVTALQALPPRQLAVLILRDVLGYPAAEVAGLLDATTSSVNSALKRARAALQLRRPDGEPAPEPGSPAEQALVARFVTAYESADLDGLVALLTDDVFVSMPPLAFEYQGRDPVARFFARLFAAGRLMNLRPTRANGQPAFGAYLRHPDGPAAGLFVLTLSGDRISAMTRFEPTVFPRFGLPPRLP